jgi:hypothetical protein
MSTMRSLPATLVAAGTALALALTLSACGGTETDTEETSPGDVAMLYVEAFRGGPEGLTGYNPDSSWDDTYFESLGASAREVVGEPLDAGQTERVAAAYREALGQIEAEVIEEQVDGDAATVTLAMRGLAYGAAMEAAGQDFVLDRDDPTGSYTSLVLEALATVEPVDDPMEVEMTFTRSADLWVPSGESGAQMIQALLQ